MLNKIELTEQYKVIDKKVYAHIKETGAKRLVDPCETRVELASIIKQKEDEKAKHDAESAKLATEIANYIKLDNEIAALGYCKKDRAIYKKIDGITIYGANHMPIIDHYTHSQHCPNKEV